MPDFEQLAAQTAACADRWQQARERYAAASADWAQSLRAFADHLEGGELDELVPSLRGFAASLEADAVDAPDTALPELLRSPSLRGA